MKKREIDSRVMDTIWNNIEELKSSIRQEVNKAAMIMGYLGTFFFVISSKLSALETTAARILIVGTFIISLFLAFYVIFSGKIRQLDVFDFVDKEWDRDVILDRFKSLYNQHLHELRKKTLINNLNILFVALVTLGFLLIIL